MEEPKRPTFATIADEKRAAFISYREVMTKLAAETGDTLADIAGGLKAARVHWQHTAYVGGAERGVYLHEHDRGETVGALLEHTIMHDEVAEAQYVGTVNPDRTGWMRRPFCHALAAAGLPHPDSLLLPEPDQAQVASAPPRPVGNAELTKQLEDVIAERDTLRNTVRVQAAELDAVKVGERSERTYQNIIGGLLRLLIGSKPKRYDSQAAVIDDLLATCPDTPGITQRTLEERFAAANRSLDSV